jgi:polyhydroxyalkanoate synthesis regulator phasin
MKVLDYNSTVREGEFATAQNAANVPDRIRNEYKKLMKGGRLQTKQRQEYVNAMKESAKTQFEQLQSVVSQYENIAKNNKVGFDDVMPSHYRSFEPSISAKAAVHLR